MQQYCNDIDTVVKSYNKIGQLDTPNFFLLQSSWLITFSLCILKLTTNNFIKNLFFPLKKNRTYHFLTLKVEQLKKLLNFLEKEKMHHFLIWQKIIDYDQIISTKNVFLT